MGACLARRAWAADIVGVRWDLGVIEDGFFPLIVGFITVEI